MELLARTRIVMWEGGGLWIVDALPNAGPGPRRTDPHAHHAIQVTIGLGGAFTLQTPAAAPRSSNVRGEAVAVAADASHTFEAEGLVALLFIEPESRAGRAAARRLLAGADLAPVAPGMLGDLRPRLTAAWRARDDGALVEAGRALIASLAGDGPSDAPDLRVRRMIAHAAARLADRVSLADVTPALGLSAGRLSHLFVEQTGLPFRTYLLWLRLKEAVAAMAAGRSLTEAAHEAGFADSAHFSRTFRRMFGVAPASLRMT